MLANECGIKLRSGCNAVDEGHDAVDVNCEAVDMDCEAVDGGNIIAGTHVIDESGKVVDVDEGPKT